MTAESQREPSPEQIAAIRKRVQSDFPYFCRTFLKIKPKSDLLGTEQAYTPLIPFVLNPAQLIVLGAVMELIAAGLPVEIVILKARQFGISTLFCAWLFWLMWRQTYTRAAIVAATTDTLKELNETMDTFHRNMPEGFKPLLRQKSHRARISKEEVYFDDRKADCQFVIQAPGAMRGMARDAVVTTEVGMYKDAAEFFGGFTAVMSRAWFRTLIKESSAADGYFRDEYESAKLSKGKRAIFLPWWIATWLYTKPLERRGKSWYDAKTGDKVTFTRAERKEQDELSRMSARIFDGPPISDEQMYWRQHEIDEAFLGDEEFFHQEYPRDDVSCFMRATSGAFKICMAAVLASTEDTFKMYPDTMLGTLHSATYLDPSVDVQQVQFEEEPRAGYIDQEHRPGLLLIIPPKEGYIYTVGGDVADAVEQTEDEDDDSAFSVLCVYCCDTREQVAEWRGKIDPYDFADECAKLGYFYNTALLCVERNNMGITTENRLTRQLYYPNMFRWPDWNSGGGKVTKKIGWETNSRTKQLAVGDLRLWCRDGRFIARSPGLAHEMSRYQIHHGKYTPARGEFADRIIAAALSVQAVAQTGFGMNLVLGSSGPDVERPAGGWSRIVRSSSRSAIEPPASRLPDEFGDTAPLRIDASLWEKATL